MLTHRSLSPPRSCARGTKAPLPAVLVVGLTALACASPRETSPHDAGSGPGTGRSTAGVGAADAGDAAIVHEPHQDSAVATRQDGGNGGGGGSRPGPSPSHDADDGCSDVSVKSEVKRSPVDIIWAIDSSSSMGGEQRRVRENLGRFAAAFTAAAIDAQVVIVNKCDIAAETALAGSDRYLWVDETISSRNALDKLLKSFERWQGRLRPSAPTHFIVVSDDDASMQPAEFRAEMEAKLQHSFILHAIASEDVGEGEPCEATNCSDDEGACGGWPSLTPCEAAQPGVVYYELARETEGEQISICQDDWAKAFARLETAVVASSALPCRFNLPQPIEGRSLEVGLVRLDFTAPGQAKQALPRANDASACREARGWYYDSPMAPSEILLCPAACEAAKGGGALDIALVCSEDDVPVILF
jgi:hypothetical protein